MAATAPPTPSHAELDKELVQRADKVAEDLREMDGPKKASLVAAKRDDKSSAQDRAARFFATHGMGNIGQLLGERLSASEEAQVAKEEAKTSQEWQRLGGGASVPQHFALRAGATKAAAAPAELSMDMADIEQDEEEEAATKNRWKAVDSLRRHMPPPL